MLNIRTLVFYLILAVSAVLLQIIPRTLGHVLDFTVILAGFPIYSAARLSLLYGVVLYLAAASLSASMNMGEAVFFICTNGIIGLSLGIIKDRIRSISLVPVPSAMIVIVMLLIVNYLLGISIFGYSALKAPILQVLTLFLPIYIYCFIYLKLAMSVDNLLHKCIDLNIY